jgi:undecaprenyl-diphosphatase
LIKIVPMRNHALIKQIERWDILLFKKIFNLHGNRFLDLFMAVASHIGNGYLYPIVGVLIAIVDSTALKMLISLAVLSFVIELSVYGIIKLNFKRTRPCDLIEGVHNLTSIQDRFSFPSGHAAAAFLMATVLRFLYPQLTIPLYLIACAIGISRIYNGLHFPSDVLVGTLLGYLSAKVAILILF